MGDLCYICRCFKLLLSRYLLPVVSKRPFYNENFSIHSVCCRIDSNDLIFDNGVQRIRFWFWKSCNLGRDWELLVCRTNTKFSWYVSLATVVRLLISKLVAFAVQIFYAYRIKLLAKSNFIAVVVVLVSISFFI